MSEQDPPAAKVLQPWRLWRLKVTMDREAKGSLPLSAKPPVAAANGVTPYLAHFRTHRPFPWPAAPTPALSADAGSKPASSGKAPPKSGVGIGDYLAGTSPCATSVVGDWMAADDVAVELGRPQLRQLLQSVRADLDLQVVDGQGRLVGDPAAAAVLAWQQQQAAPVDGNSPIPPTLRLWRSGTLPLAASLRARVLPSLLVERFDALLTSPVAPIAANIPGWKDVTAEVAPLANGGATWVRKQASVGGDGVGWRVEQQQARGGGSSVPWAPNRPGPTLVFAGYGTDAVDPATNPGLWTDYRVAAQVLTDGPDSIGIVFRYAGQGAGKSAYYRFALNPAYGSCQLDRVEGASATLLAGCNWPLAQKRNYRMTVEVVQGWLRAWIDGVQVLEVTDSVPLKAGTVGLWCWHNAGARFAEIVVRDVRAQPPQRFEFAVRTDRCRSTGHMLAASQLPSASAALPQAALTTGEAAAVANPSQPTQPGQAEVLAFAALLSSALSAAPALRSPADRPRVTWLCDSQGSRHGLLVQFPQPVDWQRTLLAVASAEAAPQQPGPPKSVALRWGGDKADALACWALRETDISMASVQTLDDGDPLAADPPALPLFDADPSSASVVKLLPPMVPGALGAFRFVAGVGAPLVASWTTVANDPSLGPWSLRCSKPGASGQMALLAEAPGADVDVEVEFAPGKGADAGLLMRWRDLKNHVRCVRHSADSSLVLICREGGVEKALATITSPATSSPIRLHVQCMGDWAAVWVDDILALTLNKLPTYGDQVGLYAAGSDSVDFTNLRARTLQVAPVVRPLGVWSADDVSPMVDDTGATKGWLTNASLSAGALVVRLAAVLNGTCTLGVRADYVGNGYQLEISPKDGANQLTLRRTIAGQSIPVAGPVPLAFGSGTLGPQLELSAIGRAIQVLLNGKAVLAWWEPGQVLQGTRGYFGGPAANVAQWALVAADGSVGPFTVTDDAPSAQDSTWNWRDGVLAYVVHAGAKPGPVEGVAGAVALFRDAQWSDFDLTAAMRAGSAPLGLEFRRQDARNGYRLLASPSAGQIGLLVQVDGKLTVVASVPVPGLFAAEHVQETIRVVCIGARMRCWRGGALVFDVTDDTYLTGAAGFYSAAGGSCQFGHISVRAPGSELVAALAWSAAAPAAAKWQFLGPKGDAGLAWIGTNCGMIKPEAGAVRALAIDPLGSDAAVAIVATDFAANTFGLLVRASPAGAGLSLNWTVDPAGTPVLSLAWMGLAGGVWTAESLWTRPAPTLPAGSSCRLALIAVGNRVRGWANGSPAFDLTLPAECTSAEGEPAHVGLGAGAGPVSFSQFKAMQAWQLPTYAELDDGMQEWVPGRWRPLDATGKDVADPLFAGWTISAGALTRNVAAASVGYLALADKSAGNSRIAAVVELPGVGGSIGVFARQTADGNQVRLSVTGVGIAAWKWELVTQTAWSDAAVQIHSGKLTLAQGAAPPTALVTLDVADGQVTAHVDGVAVWRGALAVAVTGRVGVFVAGAGTAKCRRVTVQEIGWRTLTYADAQKNLAEGEHLTWSVPTTPLSVWRKVRLCDRRLRTLDERWMLPPAGWLPVAAKVLRARDGSAAAILAAPGAGQAVQLRVRRIRKQDGGGQLASATLTSGGAWLDDIGEATCE